MADKAVFNPNTFLIDRIRRGTMFSDTTGEVLWSITQINDATLSMTSETSDVTDAIGNIITQFDRSKNAEFSGSNALWDFGLSAAQFGSEKQVADSEHKIISPIYEQLKADSSHKITLSHTPVTEEGKKESPIQYAYILNNDSTLGTRFHSDATSATIANHTFKIETDTKQLVFPNEIAEGTNIAVFYNYEAENAIMLQNNASEFPKAGKFMLEVIGKDTCDKTATYVAYIVFPNAKLKTDMDLSFASDGGHPFSMQMMQDYCDLEKRLFNIYVAQ